MKEVLLQRYLEPLSKLTKWKAFLNWRGECNALTSSGQIVVEDIYNCYAIYCLSLNGKFEYGQVPKLVLVQKENHSEGTLKCIEYKLTSSIVSRVKDFLALKKGQEKLNDNENKDYKSIIFEAKTELMQMLLKLNSDVIILQEMTASKLKENQEKILALEKNLNGMKSLHVKDFTDAAIKEQTNEKKIVELKEEFINFKIEGQEIQNKTLSDVKSILELNWELNEMQEQTKSDVTQIKVMLQNQAKKA